MKFVASTVTAALFAFTAASVTATAQGSSTTQQPTAQQPSTQQPSTQQPQTQQPQTQRQQTQAQRQQVTIVGCVQREADYRRQQDAGRGGAAGTGAGAGNELVLVDASMPASSGGGAQAQGATGQGQGAAVGTAGALRGETAFELSGPGEDQAAKFVGQRVEVTGTIDMSASPTAGAPGSQDLRLREIEVASVRPATGANAEPCETNAR